MRKFDLEGPKLRTIFKLLNFGKYLDWLSRERHAQWSIYLHFLINNFISGTEKKQTSSIEFVKLINRRLSAVDILFVPFQV